MSESISFDRAAEIYDQTRALPTGIGPLIARALDRFLQPSDRLLEIGIGTGRIAAPLVLAGWDVTGIDISLRMLTKLRHNLAGNETVPAIILADAARAPFAGGSFNAVLAVHVLHLIAKWKSVLEEVRRVLVEGGCFITGYNWRHGEDPVARLRKHHNEFLKTRGIVKDNLFLDKYEDIKTWLTGSGAVLHEFSAAEWKKTCTLQEEIQHLYNRAWSETWDIPEPLYQESLREVVHWCRKMFNDLDQPFQVTRKFIWQVYRW